MHSVLKIARAGMLAIVLAGFTAPAQAQENTLPPPSDDDWQYAHRGPAKSVEVGNFYLRKGKLKAALSRFQEAAQADPNYAPALLGLGKVFERMGKDQQALDAYQRYLDQLPSAKQAEQAADVHRAIARLQRKMAR